MPMVHVPSLARRSTRFSRPRAIQRVPSSRTPHTSGVTYRGRKRPIPLLPKRTISHSDVEELGDRIPPRLARLQSIDPGRVLGPQTIDLLPDDDEPGRRRLLDIQVARSVECELEAGQVRDRRCTEHAAVIDRPGGSPSLHRIENLKTTVAHRDIARGAVFAGALSHLADRIDRAGREVGDEY